MIADKRIIEFYNANKCEFDIKEMFEYLSKLDICEICMSFNCISHDNSEISNPADFLELLINGDNIMMGCRIDALPNDDNSDCESFTPTNDWQFDGIRGAK